MIWIAIACGLSLLFLMLSLCYVSGCSERRLEEKEARARNRLYGGHRYSGLVIDEASKLTEYDYDRAQKAFLEHWERKAELKEKWSDPPEVDDG